MAIYKTVQRNIKSRKWVHDIKNKLSEQMYMLFKKRYFEKIKKMIRYGNT